VSIVDYHTHHSWRHTHHHKEVRNGEIDNEEVAGGTKAFGGAENIYHHTVTDDGYRAEDTNNEAEDCVPQRIYRCELIPVSIDHMKHLRWHLVYHRLITESSMHRPRIGCMAWSEYDRHC